MATTEQRGESDTPFDDDRDAASTGETAFRHTLPALTHPTLRGVVAGTLTVPPVADRADRPPDAAPATTTVVGAPSGAATTTPDRRSTVTERSIMTAAHAASAAKQVAAAQTAVTAGAQSTAAPPDRAVAATATMPRVDHHDDSGLATIADGLALSRPHGPRRPGVLHASWAGRVVAWQLAMVAVVLILPRPLRMYVAIVVLAVLAALVVVPLRQRSVLERLTLAVRYLIRHHRSTVDRIDDSAAEAVLRAVSRGGHLEPFEADATSGALIRHAGGLTVVLALVPSSSAMVGDTRPVVPALGELLPAGDDGGPAVTVQLIVHEVPAHCATADDAPAASYAALTGGTVPAQRRCWTVLHAPTTADDHAADELPRALANAVRRVRRKLRKAGIDGQVLGPEALRQDILALTGLDLTAEADASEQDGAPVIRERWRTWSVGSRVQTTFELQQWPNLADPAARDVLNRCASAGALATTVAVAARRAGDDVELQMVVRLTLSDDEAVPAATTALEQLADQAGARVLRLDGEQVFGVAASLPLGGFLP